jgi:hypothetical protein
MLNATSGSWADAAPAACTAATAVAAKTADLMNFMTYPLCNVRADRAAER